jgi:phytoene dehydrogenase-like protein
MTQADYDAIIVGSGPNGLAAAITLARAGRSVLVLESEATFGGGMRSAEITLPGFTHDICSAIHPLGAGSPFFRDLPLAEHGLEWIFPPGAVAHPFEDGTAVVLERTLEATARTLGTDADAYGRLMTSLVAGWPLIGDDLLAPLRPPRHPILFTRFGLKAMQSARGLARRTFREEKARGFFAGLAAHAILPLESLFTASFGLVLGVLGHTIGWPLPRGGSQRIADAMVSCLRSLGGELITGTRVESVDDLPPARAVLLDVTPRQLLKIAGHRFPGGYRRQLERYRYSPGSFKLDWALEGPIPWKAPECTRAATVHLGATLEEICVSERAAWSRQPAERPYVLVAQQSLFDSTRAPEGKHTGWAYCHVPQGSDFDMTERIEAQVERFAPGFRERILARHAMGPGALERYNSNYVGGDIGGGANDLFQLFTRPVPRLNPYTTPAKGIFLCSSSTPPGAGVHGMCGYFAAQTALEAIRQGRSG